MVGRARSARPCAARRLGVAFPGGSRARVAQRKAREGWNVGKHYTVSDGELVLTLEEAKEGGFIVTSPMDPELITEADDVREAFDMARDAMEALMASRRKPLLVGRAEAKPRGKRKARRKAKRRRQTSSARR